VLSPCTAANYSSTESLFGLYSTSTAQLGAHQPTAIPAPWRGQQQSLAGSMAVPAQLQQQLSVAGASAQELQDSVCSNSKSLKHSRLASLATPATVTLYHRVHFHCTTGHQLSRWHVTSVRPWPTSTPHLLSKRALCCKG
jgi:hypothetical protein